MYVCIGVFGDAGCLCVCLFFSVSSVQHFFYSFVYLGLIGVCFDGGEEKEEKEKGRGGRQGREKSTVR